jgi:hypothetical protein
VPRGGKEYNGSVLTWDPSGRLCNRGVLNLGTVDTEDVRAVLCIVKWIVALISGLQ